jgi:hypothetical protein
MSAFHDPCLDFFSGSATSLRTPRVFYLLERRKAIADMPFEQIANLLFHRAVIPTRDGLQ